MRLIDADKIYQILENKSSYGYVSALDISSIEIVKAIPTEWIEKFMNRFRLGMVTSDEYALLHFMLTEWEVENEKDI